MSIGTRPSLAVAARLARREVRRHPWRHLLVTALIFVPVATALLCFSALATFQDYTARTDGYRDRPAGGVRTPVSYLTDTGRMSDDPPTAANLGLPRGTHVETAWNGVDWFVTDQVRSDGQGPELAAATVHEAADGSASGTQFAVTEGRLPRDASEILLTMPLAEADSWSIGDTVTSARGGQELEVVGLGYQGEDVNRPSAAVADQPDTYWTKRPVGLRTIVLPTGARITTGSDQDAIAVPESHRPSDMDRFYAESDFGYTGSEHIDARVRPGLTLAAAALCAVVAIVASAAFAISSRRQLRSVGLLATVGTDPGTIRWAMVLQGAIPGLAAGLIAVAVGVAITVICNANDFAVHVTDVYGSRLVLSWGGALLAIGLGTGAGIAAAWQPARTVSRVPTLAALAGRRPVAPVPAKVPVAGAILWVIGACTLMVAFGIDRSSVVDQLQPFLIIGGIAAFALGSVGLAPLLVGGLDGLAARTKGTTRISLRGLARHRTQSAAAVAAIAVALALPVGLLTTRNMLQQPEHTTAWATNTARSTSYPDDDRGRVPTHVAVSGATEIGVSGAVRSRDAAEAVDEIVDVVGPSAAVIRTIPIPDINGSYQLVATIDEDQAASVLDPWAAEAIAQGKAVRLSGDEPRLRLSSGGASGSFETVEAPPGKRATFRATDAAYLLGIDALGQIGAGRPPDDLFVLTPDSLTREQRRAIDGLDGNGPPPPVVANPTLASVRAAVAKASDAPVPNGQSQEIWIDIDDGRQPTGITEVPDDPNHWWDRALQGAVLASWLLALMVLAITLSLRAVDGEADQQAAAAAGVSPARLRSQRAIDGVVLALLGALLALPLGWIPVAAARMGSGSGSARALDGQRFILGNANPGWIIIPVLVVPAIAVAVLWTAMPALSAAIRRARGRANPDLIVTRW